MFSAALLKQLENIARGLIAEVRYDLAAQAEAWFDHPDFQTRIVQFGEPYKKATQKKNGVTTEGIKWEIEFSPYIYSHASARRDWGVRRNIKVTYNDGTWIWYDSLQGITSVGNREFPDGICNGTELADLIVDDLATARPLKKFA